jgi:hypothetical protein
MPAVRSGSDTGAAISAVSPDAHAPVPTKPIITASDPSKPIRPAERHRADAERDAGLLVYFAEEGARYAGNTGRIGYEQSTRKEGINDQGKYALRLGNTQREAVRKNGDVTDRHPIVPVARVEATLLTS